MASQSNIKVKVNFNDDTRVWRYSSRSDYEGLCAFIADAWDHRACIAQYKDDEDDLITIASSQDLQDAFDSVEQEQKRSLKIFVQSVNTKPTTQVPDAKEEEQEQEPEETQAPKKPFSSFHEMALNFLQDVKMVALVPVLVGTVVGKIKNHSSEVDEDNKEKENKEVKVFSADEIAALITCEVGENEQFAALYHHPLYQQYATMAIPYIAQKIAAQQSLYKHFRVSTIQSWVTQLMNMLRQVASRPGGLCAYKQAIIDIQYPEQTDDGLVIHYGVECDVCGQYPIIGDRYKCTERHNWDCCSDCEPQQETPLIKFKKARSTYRGRAFRRLASLLRRHAQKSPCQQQPQQDEVDISGPVLCVCGTHMEQVVAKRAYRDCNTVYCDLCNQQFFNESVYHCPTAKNVVRHPNGYDLCLGCAQTQVQQPEPEVQPEPEQPQPEQEQEQEAEPESESEQEQEQEPEPEQVQEPEQEAEAEVEEEEPIESEIVEVFMYQSELDQIKDIMGVARDDNQSDMVVAIKQLLVDNKGDVTRVVPALFQ